MVAARSTINALRAGSPISRRPPTTNAATSVAKSRGQHHGYGEERKGNERGRDERLAADAVGEPGGGNVTRDRRASSARRSRTP